MYKAKDNLEKICNLYASDWHMLTTVLAYLKNKNLTFEPTAFISEKNLKNDFEFILSKLSISEDIQKSLRNIPWYKNILNLGIHKNSTYIISGSPEYISTINKHFEEKNSLSNVTIINCFPALDNNLNLKEILSKHTKVLNSSGVKKISEIFPSCLNTN